MKHKHAEVIKAFVDGIECEYYSHELNKWGYVTQLETFDWAHTVRIKPEPKPDLIDYVKVGDNFEDSNEVTRMLWASESNANLKLFWDGETGKLKSAEVIKNV